MYNQGGGKEGGGAVPHLASHIDCHSAKDIVIIIAEKVKKNLKISPHQIVENM